VLAFGDSITNGGGELQWGVALQSWALWVARGLGLPFTGYAVDGAVAAEVLRRQIPAFEASTATPDARYDVGCLYIGVNDVRGPGWGGETFAADHRRALAFVTARCDRTLVLTAPLALGVPPAGAKVAAYNAIVRRNAAEAHALLVELRDFRARNHVMADRVHPTAFGQIAIAERALAVLERDGLPARIAPASVISFQTTHVGRLRADWTYAYRSAKLHARALVLRRG
jgi:lysophospholipase L1-like esterase